MKNKIASWLIAALVPALVLSIAVPASVSAASSTKYTVTLKPTQMKNSKGTPITVGSGTATVTLYPARRQVCWSITVHSIKLPATHAYIMSTQKGSVGSTVVTLSAPGTSGTSSGCTRRGLSRNTIKTIQSNPARYYVVVETTDYPVGALRGLL